MSAAEEPGGGERVGAGDGAGDGVGVAAGPVRYKLVVCYDGTDFVGWQKQEPPERSGGVDEHGVAVVGGAYGPGARLIEHDRPGRVALRTVQGVLERVVREVVRERVELVGASRTDSGVHARGQVCAFTSVPDGKGTGWPLARGPERLVMALNARLDEDVVVRSAGVVEGGFDPIGGAVRKRYTYTIWAGRRRPLWDRRYVWWLSRGGLDVAKMHDAAQALVGEHDFASFAAPGHGRLSTVRRVFVCGVREVRGEGDGEGGDGQRVVMTIEGNGFLWNMVRIIAGSLVEVGLGQRPVAWVGGSLEARDRLKAGPTAPPTGLCLERVWYAGEGA